ncbi:carboxymuconolactone decarboxylase family protein [Halomonas piscis]|uniref:carboxymuconolactone decarboxylase family protein n=1 Tax=Halomonas piscis TaxID=3031727 RepID=UPI0028A2D4A7|nr:carboxymuconolactone decarboxylase family protein [Halomonas piscis]
MASERYRQGMEKLKELTAPEDGKPTGHMEVGESFKDIAPDLSRMVVEFAFGDVYSRPGLENKQKVLATISALVAQGTPQIGMHVVTGLQVGLTPDEIAGCIIHLIPYVGFPRALSALKVAQDVFAEQGVAISDELAEELKAR